MKPSGKLRKAEHDPGEGAQAEPAGPHAAGLASRMGVSDLITLGRWEWVDLPGIASEPQKARVDTGARRTVLHAVEMVISEGQVIFTLPCGATARRPIVRSTRIRSSNGESEVRPVVEVPVTVGGLTVFSRCTLTDRSSMRFPILIGRDVLSGRFTVDPSRGGIHPRPRRRSTT